MTAVTHDVLTLLTEGLSDRAVTARPTTAEHLPVGSRDRPLIGRLEEQHVLAGLVAGVQDGLSGVLVLVGEPGTGKTRLLDQAAAGCPDVGVVRIAGVESEAHLGFAGLHRLLRQWSPRIEGLPIPQRDALRSAFGQVAGVAADRYLVGMAALTLLADAASVQPLLCVVDDVQWLDRESAEALAFVARRLHAETVGFLFATRPRSDGSALFDGLPVMTVSGLPDRDAGRLLSASVAGRLDDAVAAKIVTGTGGNPLALIELARTLTAEQLSGLAPLPGPLPVGRLLETHFLQQVQAFPADTRALLLVVAAAPPGDPSLLWRAAGHLGIAASAADTALSAGVLTHHGPLDFRHPLIRSAVYRGAGAVERRRVHAALAAVSDQEHDRDRRAWHRAHATIGLDEQVAAELETASEHARSRGGHAEQAAFLSRAADLTPDARDQAARLVAAAHAYVVVGDPAAARKMLDRAELGLDRPVLRARARQIGATAELYLGRVATAPAILLDAAESIADLDPRLARKMMFEALQVVLITYDRSVGVTPQGLARAVLASPAMGSAESTFSDLLLNAYATRIAVGHRPAVPLLRGALEALHTDGGLAEDGLPLAVVSMFASDDVWDDEGGWRAWKRLEAYDRENRALGALRTTLMIGSLWELRAGRFSAAGALQDELADLSSMIGQSSSGDIQRIELLAWSGRQAETRALAAAARTGSTVGLADFARNCLAVLELSLGRYAEALACVLPSFEADRPGTGTRSLHEIVEAGVRSGDHVAAKAALTRLEERALAADTAWGLGLLSRCRALMVDDDHGERLYRESIELLGHTRITTELARSHLLFGEWLRRRKRRGDARRELRTAYEMFTGMGAAAFAERARVELSATGEHPRKRTTPHTNALTPREKQIAILAASGVTNSEIAARLFLSTSTIEYHLNKIFRKLDVTSRRKLAPLLQDAP
ncbi:helix-turn-helix transcriptional regulator [Planotetraspora mira]|uniref:Transcriptional regulator n=1 Tax=Planotetraspora mira TaxID=58121 RepID=A0A8J3X9Y1_9ACTN|nr:LuxR family transcriptional regulator [Planotetraspora mira]GII32464.1 transcriptional regulator [Planotetraspora mira]